MNIKLSTTSLLIGALLLPVGAYAADNSKQTTTEKVKEEVTDTGITTRVKARMATDKQVDAANISVTTVDGVVQLSGTAKSKAEANKAVAIARQVPNVKSVKSDIQVTGAAKTSTTTSSPKAAKHSDQPVDDTMITTKVKARMATDKQVSAMDISVTTVNGVVQLSGTAKSKAEADHAVSIARRVDHVKSVTNNIQVNK